MNVIAHAVFLLLLAQEDGLTGELELRAILARRHTIANATRIAGSTSGSSSERNSLSPPPCDVALSPPHSGDVPSNITINHDNQVLSCCVMITTSRNLSSYHVV